MNSEDSVDHGKFNKLVFIPAVIFFIVQLFTGNNFPVFRDEFYYLDCASRLSIGYVDQPPFSILILSVWKFFFGNSLLSIRILPALFGSLFIICTGIIAKELGGNKLSQLFASIVVFCAPVYWALCGFYSMNSIDILVWCVLFIILIKLINKDDHKLWLLLGAAAGIGLMNKISVGYFGIALAVSILFTPLRKWYLNKFFWIFGAISMLIFSPYVLWNIQNDMATIEFIRNAALYKNAHLSFVNFLKELILQAGPVNLLIWVTGLISLFFYSHLKKYRLLGFIFIFVLLIVFLNNGKPYYMAAAFPVLLAAGSVSITNFFKSKRLKMIPYAFLILNLVCISFLLPVVVPVLPPPETSEYLKKLGLTASTGENNKTGSLPQLFADRFGWVEMAETTAKVYNSLTAEEKQHTLIFTQNYGEAGAINYYGKNLGLPRALSGHNNHYLWPPPDSIDITTMIIIGGDKEDHLEYFGEVTEVARVNSVYSMPYENDLPVFIARKPRFKLNEAWKRLKHYI
jgi:hypothetical protein